MYNETEIMAAAMLFYMLFLGLWWLGCAIVGHALLNKKGYRHAGLYILAWAPMLNLLSIFLIVGLPDIQLNRKIDYLLQQLAANGLIRGQAQPCHPQSGGFNTSPAYQAAPGQAVPNWGNLPPANMNRSAVPGPWVIAPGAGPGSMEATPSAHAFASGSGIANAGSASPVPAAPGGSGAFNPAGQAAAPAVEPAQNFHPVQADMPSPGEQPLVSDHFRGR